MINITETVNAIGRINFEGNIVPVSWLQFLKTDANKPDAIAALLLSDIIYWYRPTIIRDETTGREVARKKKFRSDKLQRSYGQFAKQFGFSKTQVTRALKRLENNGFITLELRNIKTEMGVVSNVLFIEPIPSKIAEITFQWDANSHNLEGGMDKFVDTSLSTNSHTPPYKFVDTYTKTTTKTISSGDSAINGHSASCNLSSSNKANIYSRIHAFWNSKDIIKHRSLNDKTKRAINSALKDFTADEIECAISNYARILKDDSYYFTYKWTLQHFLQRGLDSFREWDVCHSNYRKEKDKSASSGEGEGVWLQNLADVARKLDEPAVIRPPESWVPR